MVTSFDKDGKLLNDVSSDIEAIVFLGFQHIFELDPKSQKPILVKESLTYDVDVFWKSDPPESWKEFEVNPKNPIHSWL